MQYYSLHYKAPRVSFREAVVKGIAPDRGLYFPEKITPLESDFFKNLEKMSDRQIAYHSIRQFIGGEIPDADLQGIIEDTLQFPFPLVAIKPDVYALELFHGPTMAFKDVGARFMARCLGYFNAQNKTEEVTVLVATSGDTGGAVASGFLYVKGVNVVILYPKGKVSNVQKKQLTTLGANITALEVDGTFDDCQEMVKKAFLDEDLKVINFTSANSINVARWLPQMWYYFFAYKQLRHTSGKIVFSVPSGNFGNICAGMIARSLGLPVHHFIAATNSNDTVPSFLKTGIFNPQPSVPTISNAMDVGDPSNFIRIRKLTNNDLIKLKKQFSSYSFTDAQTKKAIKYLYKNFDYTADPHGAVGYLGLDTYMNGGENVCGVFLETAHPVKFPDVVEPLLKKTLEIPPQIERILNKKEVFEHINRYQELKSFLLGNFTP